MSDLQELNLKSLSNDELISLALEWCGEQQESIRHAALLEHHLRTENAPTTLKEKAGEFDILHLKIQQLIKSHQD